MSNKLGINFTGKSLIKYVIPSIIMMVFLSLYTIIDGMFISRFVGTTALSSTNIIYPLIALEQGIGIMLTTGTGAIVSTKMGKGDNNEAYENFTFVTCVNILIGFLFLIFGNLFIDEIITLLGASPEQFPPGKDYLKVNLYFAPFLFLQIYFQYLLSVAGKPEMALRTTLISGILNIILDYIFMVPFKMGIKGAAIATVIGYIAATLIGVLFFITNKDGLRFVKFKLDFKMLISAMGNGASEMIGNLAAAITTFMFNIAMLKYYGDNGVAAITIILYFQFLFSAIFLGYAAGVGPIISYKHGEKNYIQLKKILKISLQFIIFSSILMFVVSRLTINYSLKIFTGNNLDVLNISKKGFKIFSYSFLFTGFPIMASALFTSFSNGKVSAIISFARTFLFIAASILILPKFIGPSGIWLAIPLAEFLSLILSYYYVLKYRKIYGY